MTKLFHTLILSLPFLLASCSGTSQEELPIKYGSERSELAGNPATMKQVVIDYEDVAPGGRGTILSEDLRTYDKDGNILTYSIEYKDSDYNSYKQSFEYNDKGVMTRYEYDGDDGSYFTLYTLKGNLITKAQNYFEDEATSYYKYTYKGNKEVSRSLFNGLGIKLTQTDYTWDGDKVVKEVEQDLSEVGATTTTRYIEYPDDNTEIIRLEEDGEAYYTVTITYNEKGDFASVHSVSDEEENRRVYSYEYDGTGNWIKRTVATPDGDTLWIETREFTYHS